MCPRSTAASDRSLAFHRRTVLSALAVAIRRSLGATATALMSFSCASTDSVATDEGGAASESVEDDDDDDRASRLATDQSLSVRSLEPDTIKAPASAAAHAGDDEDEDEEAAAAAKAAASNFFEKATAATASVWPRPLITHGSRRAASRTPRALLDVEEDEEEVAEAEEEEDERADTSQTRIVWSLEAETSSEPHGDRSSASTMSAWPDSSSASNVVRFSRRICSLLVASAAHEEEDEEADEEAVAGARGKHLTLMISSLKPSSNLRRPNTPLGMPAALPALEEDDDYLPDDDDEDDGAIGRRFHT